MVILKGRYCFALWFGHLIHSGHHILPYISDAFNVSKEIHPGKEHHVSPCTSYYTDVMCLYVSPTTARRVPNTTTDVCQMCCLSVFTGM